MAYIDKLRPVAAQYLEQGESVVAAARGVAKGMTKYAVIGAIVGFIPSFLLAQSQGFGLTGPIVTGLGTGLGVALGYVVGARMLRSRGFPPIFTLAATESRLLVLERDFWGRITRVAASPAIGDVAIEVGKGGLFAANPGTIGLDGATHPIQFPKVENLEPLVEAVGGHAR